MVPACDGFVLTSRSEGLSCSIVEAMSAGLPAVVTDVGGNSELVIEGRTGHRVPCGDDARLAAHLGELCLDGDRRRRLGSQAHAHIRDHFSIDAMLDGYAAIYGELLER